MMPALRYGRLAAVSLAGAIGCMLASTKLLAYAPVSSWLFAWGPSALGGRVAHVFGFRYDVASETATWQYWVICLGTELLIWASLLFLLGLAIRGGRKRRSAEVKS